MTADAPASRDDPSPDSTDPSVRPACPSRPGGDEPAASGDISWLAGPAGRAGLAHLSGEAVQDWEHLSTGQVAGFRKRFGDRTPVLLTQMALRQRARGKFGDLAERMLFTRDGLEQATRPAVARHRAQRLRAAGVRRILDLGCGIGADAWALVREGIDVVAVERDPDTAALACANLAAARAYGGAEAVGARDGAETVGADDSVETLGTARVVCADVLDVAEDLFEPGMAVFLDPARRTGAGRTWNPADFTPPWDWAMGWLDRAARAGGVGCAKLGPGLPHRMIGEEFAAEWVSHHGDLVEVCLWAGLSGPRGETMPERTATVLDGPEVTSTDDRPVGGGDPLRRQASIAPEPGMLLWEPDPAVIRAGLVDVWAAHRDLARLDPQIAYLVGRPERDGGEGHRDSWTGQGFVIREVLSTKEKVLRAYVRAHRIGRLEIKKRGIDMDPALLRKKLKPAGPEAATFVLTPTPVGARTLVVDRVGSP